MFEIASIFTVIFENCAIYLANKKGRLNPGLW